MQDRLTELYPLRDATASTTTTSTTATYDTPVDPTVISNKQQQQQQQQQQANRLLSSKAAQEQARLKLRSSQVPSWARTGKVQPEAVVSNTPLRLQQQQQQHVTTSVTTDNDVAMLDMTLNMPMIMPPAPPTQAQLASLHSSPAAAQQSPVVAVSSIKSKVGSRWAQRANQQQQQQQQQAVIPAVIPTVPEVAGCAELVVSSDDGAIGDNHGADTSSTKSPQYTPPASLERLRPTTTSTSTAATDAVKALNDHKKQALTAKADSNSIEISNADVDDGDMYESDFEFEHDTANDDKASDSKQKKQALSPQYTPVVDLEMSNDDHINFDEVSAIFDVADVNIDSTANKQQPAHSSNSHSHNDVRETDELSDSHDSDLQKHSLVDTDGTNDDEAASDMDESVDTNDIAIDLIDDDDNTNNSVNKAERNSNTNTGSDSDHAEDGLAMIEHK
eukprot:21399-Heterococcus_DN1.PRE.1